MPRRRGKGQKHARGRCRAQEATVRALVAGAVAAAHAAHDAALLDPAGGARTFLGKDTLLVVRAWNGAGAPALLLAIHRIVNAVQLGLVGPKAALYRYWMEWRMSNQSGRPLSIGDALRLTGEESSSSLHSSAPALLNALRTRQFGDAAPYLNQAHATYPKGCASLTRRSVFYIRRTST